MPPTFREQIRDLFAQTFGEYETIPVSNGDIWRWILKRPHNLDLYVTIDSPEMPHLAHLIVSDPTSNQIEPVVSHTVRTLEEAIQLVEQIKIQWNSATAT